MRVLTQQPGQGQLLLSALDQPQTDEASLEGQCPGSQVSPRDGPWRSAGLGQVEFKLPKGIYLHGPPGLRNDNQSHTVHV